MQNTSTMMSKEELTSIMNRLSVRRPRLEYASEVWSPHTSTLVDKLEHVQRAAACFVFDDCRRTTSATPVITKLGWNSLHVRRLLAQSATFHKIHYHLINISFPSCIVPVSYIAHHDYQLKYQIRLSFSPYIHVLTVLGTEIAPFTLW